MRAFERLLVQLFGVAHSGKTERKYEKPLSASLKKNMESLQKAFHDCYDFSVRDLRIGKEKRQAVVLFLQEMVDKDVVQKSAIEPLQQTEVRIGSMEQIHDEILSTLPTKLLKSEDEVIESVLKAETVILIDGLKEAVSLSLKNLLLRSLDEPAFERTIIGPREGFIEGLKPNVTILRRRLRNVNFKTKLLQLGQETETSVAVCYMENKAKPELVQEVLERLHGVTLPEVLDTSYLTEAIEDHPHSLFPQIIYTERPDRVIGNLLEGRVAILVDGSPSALIAPAGFFDFFHSPEDYYLRPLFTVFFRAIRALAAFLTLVATASYVAVVNFHYELIPSDLLVSIAETRALVPFQATLEAVLLEVSVEMIREASARLPKAFGQTIGIVGALVIGDAAIRANLVGPLLVIIVALTTIGSFAIPAYNQAVGLRLARFPVILAAGALGGFGIMFALIWLMIHLCSLDSFGLPYLRPVAPLRKSALRDLLNRPVRQI